MSKIDVSQWKEFKVGDLFDVGTGASVSKTILDMHSDGNIPRISVSNENNGVIGTFSKFDDKNMRYFTNFISVNFFGHAFYHSELASLEMKVHALTLKDHRSFTTSIALFLVSLLNTCFEKESFDYGHQLSSFKLKTGNFRIKLPVTSDGKPDWDYMDSYIAELAARAHKDVSSLNRVKPKPHKINIDNWKRFKIGDLFEKILTKKVPFKALDLPQISNSIQDLPLVAAGVDNQGRNRYVDPSCATVLSNCLTVSANGANSGAVFYQDSDFSILQDAYALQLVDMYKKHRVQNIYLFLASVLTNVLVNNDWINKATWRTVQSKEIYLPITSDAKPDWEYMDNYIAELTARVHRDVSSLYQVKPKPHKIN